MVKSLRSLPSIIVVALRKLSLVKKYFLHCCSFFFYFLRLWSDHTITCWLRTAKKVHGQWTVVPYPTLVLFRLTWWSWSRLAAMLASSPTLWSKLRSLTILCWRNGMCRTATGSTRSACGLPQLASSVIRSVRPLGSGRRRKCFIQLHSNFQSPRNEL